MYYSTISICTQFVLVCGATLAIGAAHAQAPTPAGQITQLSGMVTTSSAGGGKFKILATRSMVGRGATLQTEPGTYARVTLADGRVATLGSDARVTFKAPDTLELQNGSLELRAAPGATGRLSIVAGDSVIDATQGSVVLQLIAEEAKAIALRQRAYAQAALASSEPATLTDAAPSRPVWSVMTDEVVAQNTAPRPTAPGLGRLSPGLHVFVMDGIITLSNKAGSQNFSAGQFGYTANVTIPPVLVPANPGIRFTPPPAFSSSVGPQSGQSSMSGAGAVDCIVR